MEEAGVFRLYNEAVYNISTVIQDINFSFLRSFPLAMGRSSVSAGAYRSAAIKHKVKIVLDIYMFNFIVIPRYKIPENNRILTGRHVHSRLA